MTNREFLEQIVTSVTERCEGLVNVADGPDKVQIGVFTVWAVADIALRVKELELQMLRDGVSFDEHVSVHVGGDATAEKEL